MPLTQLTYRITNALVNLVGRVTLEDPDDFQMSLESHFFDTMEDYGHHLLLLFDSTDSEDVISCVIRETVRALYKVMIDALVIYELRHAIRKMTQTLAEAILGVVLGRFELLRPGHIWKSISSGNLKNMFSK